MCTLFVKNNMIQDFFDFLSLNTYIKIYLSRKNEIKLTTIIIHVIANVIADQAAILKLKNRQSTLAHSPDP